MTPKQKALYWRAWGRVRTVLIDLGGYSPTEADAERKAIMLEAAGTDSSKTLTNPQLDKILDAFDLAAVLLTGPTDSDRTTGQPIKRLIYRIEQTGFPDSYISQITRAQFNTSDWRALTDRQLTRLSYTLASRARTKAKS